MSEMLIFMVGNVGGFGKICKDRHDVCQICFVRR